MDYKSALIELIEDIETHQGIIELTQGLYTNGIINQNAYLGGDDIKLEIKEKVKIADFGDDTKNENFIQMSSLNLREIYTDRKNKVNRTFYFGLIFIGFAIALIIIGSTISFIEKNQVKMGIITTLCSILPGVISGTIFRVYKNESENLKPMERDIIRIFRIEIFFDMAKHTKDKSLKAKIYEALLNQMNTDKKVIIL